MLRVYTLYKPYSQIYSLCPQLSSRIYNVGVIQVSVNCTLPISLYHSTHKSWRHTINLHLLTFQLSCTITDYHIKSSNHVFGSSFRVRYLLSLVALDRRLTPHAFRQLFIPLPSASCLSQQLCRVLHYRGKRRHVTAVEGGGELTCLLP
jgi:hypothetical protein